MPSHGMATEPTLAQEMQSDTPELWESEVADQISNPRYVFGWANSRAIGFNGYTHHQTVNAPTSNNIVVLTTGQEAHSLDYTHQSKNYTFNIVKFNLPVTIVPTEIDDTTTGQQIVDILRGNVRAPMETYKVAYEDIVLGDGTYASNGVTSGQMPQGLKKIISSDDYGGLSAGDIVDVDGNNAWESGYNEKIYGKTYDETNGEVLTTKLLYGMKNYCARRNGRPGVIISKDNLYDGWALHNVNYNPQNLVAPSVLDNQSPHAIIMFEGYQWIRSQSSELDGTVSGTDRLYMLDADSIKFWYHPKRRAVMGNFIEDRASEPQTAKIKCSIGISAPSRRGSNVSTAVLMPL